MLRVERIDLGGEFHSCCKHSFGPSGAVNDLSVSTEGGGHSVHRTETSSCEVKCAGLGHQDEQLLRERRPDISAGILVRMCFLDDDDDDDG